MPNLTDLAIRSAAPGTTLWDQNVRGLGCRVLKNRRTWIILGGPGRRHAIGHYPAMTLAEARTEAKKRLAQKTLGHSPPSRTAWEDAVKEYLEECERTCRSRTVKDYRYHLSRHFPFGRRAVSDITPRDVLRQLTALNDRPGEKEHAFRVARTFFRWAIRQHLIDASPMARMETPPLSRPRERVLTREELKAVWKEARTLKTPYHGIMALLILTGQRRSEIARMEWDWFNEQEGTLTIPSDIAKNGRRHEFPVGNEVRAVLITLPRLSGSQYVFPALRKSKPTTTVFNGWTKPHRRFQKDCGVGDFTRHDLRRTLSSLWAALQIPQVVCEKYLNHISSGVQSPISQVYNRHRYLDEMRQAVLEWERYLTTLGGNT